MFTQKQKPDVISERDHARLLALGFTVENDDEYSAPYVDYIHYQTDAGKLGRKERVTFNREDSTWYGQVIDDDVNGTERNESASDGDDRADGTPKPTTLDTVLSWVDWFNNTFTHPYDWSN